MAHSDETILTSPGRLAAIEASDLLGADALPTLDRIVRAAARLLDVSAVQLSVITADEHVTVGQVGEELWAASTDLMRSIGRHTVREARALPIRNTREDPLTSSPADALIGSCIAVPIFSSQANHPIAVLCAADSQPREWNDHDTELLADLAAWAQSEIESRAAQRRALVEGEEALRAAEARLQLALDAAELGDWELDLRTESSPVRSLQHDRIFGYGDGVVDWSYNRFVEHVHPDDRDEVDRRYRVALERGEAWDFECRIRRLDGDLRWIWARGGIHRDSSGRPARAIGIIMDITARKRAEAERERLLEAERVARSAAEAADRAKSQFVAMMSHELRTPLNAISGYADLLEMGVHGELTEPQRKSLKAIQRSQQHLLGLIDEVLSYAKLESGSVDYRLSEVNLQETLASIGSLVAPQAHARDITLTIHECPAELAVLADPDKIRQILLNLLGNAVKFTDADGSVELLCHPEGDRVHIVIRDTGVGIPAASLDSIFEPFVQGHPHLTRTAQGTGLGLAISRDLARGMGGDLTVESEPGRGSSFTVSLPTVAAPADCPTDGQVDGTA